MASLRLLLACLLAAAAAAAAGDAPAFASASLAVATAKDGSNKAAAQASFPNKAQSLAATQEQDLSVNFKVTGLKGTAAPDQLMAVLAGKSGVDYSVLARPLSEGSAEFVAHFPLGKVWDTLASGDYDVTLYLSDPAIKESQKWVVGSVALKFDPKPKGMPPPLFQHNLLYDSDIATAKLPEIHHQFRAPDRRAPDVVALAFSGVVASIFGGFALLVLHMSGSNLLKVVTSPSSTLFTLNLAALLGLFLWYWLGRVFNGPSMNELWVYALPVALTLAFTARNAVGTQMRRSKDSLKSE